MTQDVAWYDAVWENYRKHGRHDLPWRLAESTDNFNPYNIMVSEVMLQQTQVARVLVKYPQFLQQFPTVAALAHAPLADVLVAWSGLGYNRRAKFLWQAAQMVEREYDGAFPKTVAELTKLPGVGVNTAGAIVAYAFDQPVCFIETNIRTVLINYLFAGEMTVKDAELNPYVQWSIDEVVQTGESPREWYWALMDHGTFIKKTVGNMGRQSATYTKQSRFEGSRRQIRGAVLRLLGEQPLSYGALLQACTDDRLQSVLTDLIDESIIHHDAGSYYLGQRDTI